MARTMTAVGTDTVGDTIEMVRNEDGSFSIESAYLAGAKQAGLFVQDGVVYGGQDGYLFAVPAPESCEAIMAFFAYSLVKHCEYRIAQNKGGDLSAEAAAFVKELSTWKPLKSVNAGEAVYKDAVENTVRNLITGADGNEVVIKDTYLQPYDDENGARRLAVVPKGTEGKVYPMQTVIDAIAKDERPKAFDRVIATAIERGRNKPIEEKGETKRGGRKPRSMDLGISLS